MPTYQFKNKQTEEIIEKIMKISELDQFKQDNPDLEVFIGTAPVFGDPVRLGITKPPADFQKGVIDRIANSVPGNRIKEITKFQTPREW